LAWVFLSIGQDLYFTRYPLPLFNLQLQPQALDHCLELAHMLSFSCYVRDRAELATVIQLPPTAVIPARNLLRESNPSCMSDSINRRLSEFTDVIVCTFPFFIEIGLVVSQESRVWRSDQRKSIKKLHSKNRTNLDSRISRYKGPKSSTVVPCGVVELVTLVRLRSKMLCL